jgi:hypothetical protein
MGNGGGGRAPDAGEVGELDQEAHAAFFSFSFLLFGGKIRGVFFFSGYGFVDWDILLEKVHFVK